MNSATPQQPDRHDLEAATLPPGNSAQLSSVDNASNVRPLATSRRNRRRRQVPAWAVSLQQTVCRGREFLTKKLPGWLKANRKLIITYCLSFFLHALAAGLLSLWIMPPELKSEWMMILSTSSEEEAVEQPVAVVDLVQPEILNDQDADSTMKQLLSEMEDGLNSLQTDDPLDRDFQLPLDELESTLEVPTNLGEFGGRSTAGKQAAIRKYGGTGDSEQAVNSGLKWIASIQQKKDGSWSFGQVGNAGDAGSMNTTDMGATALSLLCFLGAGHTHDQEGPYQEVVKRGLTYLFQNSVRDFNGADLRGRAQGNSGMYVQGIATICICEAAAMSPKDRELRKLALEAVRFIERAQDPVGGGWRYQPREPGDTSVVGWQIMALQSAKSSRIRVDNDTMRDARQFLRSVSIDEGAGYAYMPNRLTEKPSMTAVGLLCRMYMGWNKDNPALVRGVNRLSAIGPSRTDIYYNYYAAQVMHHFCGEHWDRWNAQMRPALVESQVKEGPGAGSWNVTDPHGSGGGRIYQTALSILTLEVYYRHLPIYRKLENVADTDGDTSNR